MSPIVSRQCELCKHLTGFSRDSRTPRCEAFPAGIPDKISDGDFDHRKPYRGDGGVQFEAASS